MIMFKLFKKEESQPVAKPIVTYVSTYIVGTDHYESDKFLKVIEDELVENDNYTLSNKELLEEYDEGERIYQYEPYLLRFKVVPEPTNEYDPNALKVIIMYEGIDYFIGYIPKAKCKAFLKSIQENIIPSLSLVGGKYKLIGEDEVEKDSTAYSYLLEYGIKKGG